MIKIKKRKIIDGIIYGVMAAAMTGVIVVLLFIIFYIFKSQAGFLKISFLFGKEDGILPMIITTL